jgi:hypothetical protein
MRTIADYGIELLVPQCIHKESLPVSEIRDVRKIEEVILDHIKTNCVFILRRLKHVEEAPGEMTGLLICDFTLNELRQKCGLSANDDKLILEVMDRLAGKGKLLFLDIGIRHTMNHNDIFFKVVLAVSARTIPPDSVIKVIRYYPAEPLRVSERKGYTTAITDISERVQRIRERRNQRFREQFGWTPNAAEIEKKLFEEDRRAEVEFRDAVIKLAKSIDGKREKVEQTNSG